MRKPTQHQQRERALINFNDKYIHDIEIARKIINSYYRLSGLNYRLCILQNQEATYNTNYTKQLEVKETNHIKRLKSYLEPYGLTIIYCGIYPTIAVQDQKKPGNVIKESAYFYIG